MMLDYVFKDRATLDQALTHTSYGHEALHHLPVTLRDNERLEFLGDAVLDLVVSDLLLETFPDAAEGRLSKMRAAVVNERTLAQIAVAIGIPDALHLGRGERVTGGAAKPSILSSAFEAVVAAVYLDGGFPAVYPVVRRLFAPLFQDSSKVGVVAEGEIAFTDHKTRLQEMAQARWKTTPTYQLVGSHGPDHAKVFEVEARLNGRLLARAEGTSKKDAEQNAARLAMPALAELANESEA